LARFDDLTRQILNDSIILIQTDKNILDDTKDNTEKTKEEIQTDLKNIFEGINYRSLENGEKVINEFVLNAYLTRIQFSKLKNLTKNRLIDFIQYDSLAEELFEATDNIFKKVVIFGEEFKDLDLLTVSEVLYYVKIFVGLFEIQLNKLKKK